MNFEPITYQVEKLYGSDIDDPDREDRHRVIELPSGNKIHLKARDPFGFVYINFDKGSTPATLAGAYTSFTEANRAVSAYINARKQAQEIALENQRPKKVKLTPRIPSDPDDVHNSDAS